MRSYRNFKLTESRLDFIKFEKSEYHLVKLTLYTILISQNVKLKNIILLFIICSCKVFAANIENFPVYSKSMSKNIPNQIIIPNTYNNSSERFPVLYLLHGAGDNYLGWLQIAPELPNYADQYKIIIVCADGGETSWYFDSPIDRNMWYETYISAELVSAIDNKYRTRTNKNGRAIAGLSMGGHGAFYLAFRHQNIYGAAGSISGAMDIRPFQNQWDLTKRLGNYSTHQSNWDNNTIVNMAALLQGKSLQLIFDCGTSDFFISYNRQLHHELLRRKIPHEYSERPGEHSAAYWHDSIKNQLPFFSAFFNKSK